MNAHDRLAQQLSDSVRQRQPGRPRARRRRPVVLLGAVLVIGGGGAAAATALVGGPAKEKTSRSLEVRALEATRRTRGCTVPDLLKHGVLVDGSVPDAVQEALPGTAAPNRKLTSHDEAVAARVGGFRIVRASFITARFSGGMQLAAGVTEGAGPGQLLDRAACLRAREDVVRSAAENEPARDEALARLRARDDVRAGAQTFWLWTVVAGRPSGAGNVVRPGKSIPTGLLGSGTDGFSGIVQAGVTAVDVRSRRTGKTLVKLSPQHGMFAFKLPKATGPTTLRQIDATGQVVARRRLR